MKIKKLSMMVVLAAVAAVVSCGSAFAASAVGIPVDAQGYEFQAGGSAARLSAQADAISAAVASGDSAAADQALAGLFSGSARREASAPVVFATAPRAAALPSRVPPPARATAPVARPAAPAPAGKSLSFEKSALEDLGDVSASAVPAASDPAPADGGKDDADGAKEDGGKEDGGDEDKPSQKITPDVALKVIVLCLLFLLILL